MLPAEKARTLLAKRIAACRAKGALPAELLNMVGNVYALQLDARDQAQVTLPEALPDPIQRGQGAPLVERSTFPFDRAQTLELFPKLMDLVSAATPALAEAQVVIAAAMKDVSLDLDQAMQAHLRGDERPEPLPLPPFEPHRVGAVMGDDLAVAGDGDAAPGAAMRVVPVAPSPLFTGS